jgi:hypothetical protein
MNQKEKSLIFGITILVILAVALLAGILWLSGMYGQLKKEKALIAEAEQSLAQTINRCIGDCNSIQSTAQKQSLSVASQLHFIHNGLVQALENKGTEAFILHVHQSRELFIQFLQQVDNAHELSPELIADIKEHLHQLDKATAYFKGTRQHYDRIIGRFPYKWLSRRFV